MENEFDVLGFNPSDLNVYKEPETTSAGPNNVYKPKPAESKSKDGVYRAIIKPIYNPFDVKDSIVETQSYNMTDDKGFFSVVSSLTDNDKSCPIFKAWANYHFSKNPAEKLIAEPESKGGPGYFDKRYARWMTIQVMEDENHPELVGKFLLWKVPSVIADMINSRMKPSIESKKAPIPVMDYLFGRPIELEITPGPDDPQNPLRKTREISYTTSTISDDTMSVTEPDGTSMLTADEQDILDAYVLKMNKVWKSKDPEERNSLQMAINEDPNTIKLRAIYKRIMNKLKEYCPNVREEVGYKPWSENIKARVENYLNAIAEGRNPKVANDGAAAAFNSTDATPVQTTVTTPVTIPVSGIETSSNVDEDLPF